MKENEDEIFIPKSYLTVEIVRDVMAEFEWPVSYKLIDETDFFHMVIIKFETCEITLKDIPEYGIDLIFNSFRGKELNAKYWEIEKYIPNYNPDKHLDLEVDTIVDRRLDTITSVRNDMKNLQYYHINFIAGTDYSMAEKYLRDKKK
jgi:hypothetical protein